jgi:hypothetical protein
MMNSGRKYEGRAIGNFQALDSLEVYTLYDQHDWHVDGYEDLPMHLESCATEDHTYY